MNGRAGATLTEVLVAIFIMAIGLMTLLTLFPLGALTMAQAIRDDRTAQAAANAAALAEARNVRNDSTVLNVQSNGDAFTNPDNIPAGTPPVPGTVPLANADGPSYPVYVDPFGVQLTPSTPPRALISPLGKRGIPRQGVSFVSTMPGAFRWFSLLDDMTFLQDGPGTGSPVNPIIKNQVERENRYSWAYLLRRPRSSVTSVVDCTVVVYSGRTLQTQIAGTQVVPLGEYAYDNIVFDSTTNVVSVTSAQDMPFRKGGWILDATLVNGTTPEPHGFFYRIVGVTDMGGNTVNLELQQNPRLSSINMPVTSPPTGYGVLVYLENVIEVFEKGAGWQP